MKKLSDTYKSEFFKDPKYAYCSKCNILFYDDIPIITSLQGISQKAPISIGVNRGMNL